MRLTLEHLVFAGIPLLLVGLLLRRFAGRFGGDAPWNTAKDLSLAVAMGVGCTGLSGFWLADLMTNNPVTGGDFHDYCASVAAFRDHGMDGWSPTRSVASGWLPAVLSGPLGVIDGLLMGALISHAVMCGGIYMWARALHGRLAGVIAALMTCTVAPLVQLTRTVTFYPEILAVSVCTAAAAVLAVRYRTIPALIVLGTFIGLTMLMDVRGLLWALPALGLGCIAAVARSSLKRRALGLLVLIAPIGASYSVGHEVYREGVPSLERQVHFYIQDAHRRFGSQLRTPGGIPEDDHGWQTDHSGLEAHQRLGDEIGPQSGNRHHRDQEVDRGFVWGVRATTKIPSALRYIWEVGKDLPDTFQNHPQNARPRQDQVLPWLGITACTLLLAAWGLRRRPLMLLAFVGVLPPFLGAIHGASFVLYHARYLATGFAIIPVLLGVALAVMLQGGLHRSEVKTGHQWSWKNVVVPLTVLLLVTGVIPSWYGPDADWRVDLRADENPHRAVQQAISNQSGRDANAKCIDALQADFTAGHPAGSRLVDWTVGSSGGSPER